MKAVYVFNDRESTRVLTPRYGFDKKLHTLFTGTNGGVWNADSCSYFFNRKIDVDKLGKLIPDTVIVNVGKIQDTVTVSGFFNQPWADDYIEKTEPVYFSDDYLRKLETELHARKYSPKTIKNYVYYNQAICQWLKKTPEAINKDDVKKYLAHREQNENQSAASLNMSLSAIKFFFRNVLESDIIREQKRPRQDRRLPLVLSKAEIKNMIDLEKNLKHQLLLMMVYSSGLRVSEVVALKKEHIDITRKSIIIHSGKGRKDRYTITSDLAITTMTAYLKKYSITDWLFPGQPSTCHLSTRSAQHIFEKALKRAGIEKTASIHSLRHSFATHLLESGIDIRYIQDLLGHSSVRTTERYTHVARRKALAIASPMDTIDEPDPIFSADLMNHPL